VFVGTQGLHAAFVLVVPDPNGFVIGAAHNESSSRMKQKPAHPVVMSHLKTESNYPSNPSFKGSRRETVVTYSTHKSHKAHPSADVPHLNRFISGTREEEGTRFSTLLTLENRHRADVTSSIRLKTQVVLKKAAKQRHQQLSHAKCFKQDDATRRLTCVSSFRIKYLHIFSGFTYISHRLPTGI